jgi:hypothetical protein
MEELLAVAPVLTTWRIMQPIFLSKRTLIILAMTAIVITFGIYALNIFLPTKPQTLASPYTGEDQPALNAAISGVEAFFTLDYHEGRDIWLKKVCEKSTASGCELISRGIDQFWERINTSQSVISVKAEPIEKVAENVSEQVWVTVITLSSPLPGSNKTKDQAYISVEKTEEGWMFDRFLMPGEIKALQVRRNTNTNPNDEEKKQ